MKFSKLSTTSVAATLAVSSFALLPSVASAETSASLTLSNMYLWRGVNLTPDAPTISGSLDYAHESGAYLGVWTTNEDDGIETDLYAGFAGEAGDFSYDVSYWIYLYPEEGISGEGAAGVNQSLSDTYLSEIVLGGGYSDFGVTLYVSSETQGGSDYVYYTLDYSYDKYNILYGAWTYDKSGNNEYSHVTLTYSYNDNLSFAVSVAQEDITDGVETDPLFAVTYSVPLGM